MGWEVRKERSARLLIGRLTCSTDLRDTNSWTTLTKLTLRQAIEFWVDTSIQCSQAPHRYYRILPGP